MTTICFTRSILVLTTSSVWNKFPKVEAILFRLRQIPQGRSDSVNTCVEHQFFSMYYLNLTETAKWVRTTQSQMRSRHLSPSTWRRYDWLSEYRLLIIPHLMHFAPQVNSHIIPFNWAPSVYNNTCFTLKIDIFVWIYLLSTGCEK